MSNQILEDARFTVYEDRREVIETHVSITACKDNHMKDI